MSNYTFSSTNVERFCKITGKEFITNAELTVFLPDILICYRRDNTYHIHTNDRYYKVRTPRVPRFEAKFPEFPYNKNQHYRKPTRAEMDAHKKQMANLAEFLRELAESINASKI
jgi:hypothetical protein